MDNKRIGRICIFASLALVIVTLVLSIFVNSAFIPSMLLMISLLTFSLCVYKKENKKILYISFTVGVLLIITSLIYTL